MKKFISLFLVFSILALSGNIFAKERKGADLIIHKNDGQQVRGELIAVKKNSLLLMERDSGADVTVDIGDIRVITIVKGSKFLLGAAGGALVGTLSGVVLGVTVFSPYYEDNVNVVPTYSGIFGGLIGFLCGGIIGALAGVDEIIDLEQEPRYKHKVINGKTRYVQINTLDEILNKLRKKARIRYSQ